MTEGTEVAIIATENLPLAFATKGKIEEMISRIEADVKSELHDVSTARGRKAIASLAYKVAQSKVALDNAGKKLTEDARAQIDAVNEERRKIKARLDALRDDVRKPLDDWEAKEAERVSALEARRDRLRDAQPADDTSEAIEALMRRIEATAIDDSWQEFIGQAATIKDNRLSTLRASLDAAKRREFEAAELARLREEAAAREEADRARREAEEAEAARVAEERAEAERAARIEKEKKDAAERAAIEAERRAKEEAAKAQKEAEDRAEAERKAAADREAELQRQIEHERARAEAAAQAERDRIAQERKASDDAKAKREADASHRNKIAGDIAAALRTMAGNASPENIAEALIAGKIPHITVNM